MKKAALVLIAAALGVVLFYALGKPAAPPAEQTAAADGSVPPRIDDAESLADQPIAAATGDVLSAMRAFEDRQQFHDRARAYFDEYQALPPEQRQTQAAELGRDVDTYERAGELSAAEAVLLRLALLQTIEADPDRYREQAQALIERYEADAAARQAARPEDPAFEQYKAQESSIVAEVMAMEQYPEGMSRDEYLRRRLQEARVEAWTQQRAAESTGP